jgi:hypothetical protein
LKDFIKRKLRIEIDAKSFKADIMHKILDFMDEIGS